MLILASNFGGAWGLLLGCGIILLMAVAAIAGVAGQVKGLHSSTPLSPCMLVFLACFSLLPAGIVIGAFTQPWPMPPTYRVFLVLSCSYLALLPLTIAHELLKRRGRRD